MYTREDWTLFRNLTTLPQKAGVSIQELPALVAKELADNALDNAGQCSYGHIGRNGFAIANSGPSIPGTDEEVAALFSIRRPLTSTKLLRLPTRGALGNGLRVVAGAVLATGGTLFVSTNGRTLELCPQDDGSTLIHSVRPSQVEGTYIEVCLPGLGADLTWVHHAVTLNAGKTYKGNTSPWWYDADSFFELVQAANTRTVRDLISEFDGCSGSKAGQLAAPFKNRLATSLTRDEAEELLCAARAGAKPVTTARLGSVGPDISDGGYFKMEGILTRKPARGKVAAQVPFVVEAWADFNEHENPRVVCCVNRTPITSKIEHDYRKKSDLCLFGCGLKHSFKVGRECPSLILNITTPHMPLVNDGKAPDLYSYLEAIREVIEKAANRAKRQRPAGREAVSEKEVVYEHINEGAALAGGNGQYRFSQRQLFYALRPIIQRETGNLNPTFGNFTKILTAYENEYNDIKGMFRDPRGVIYNPHLKQTIPLGTLSVEAYQRPEWTFNKILYIEKEGFFEILRETQWPERNDCALMSSKGYATRAARDLLDALGDTDEPLTFFCIHDADAYGTGIYQALQEATDARAARRVKVINLGLEPEQGLAMGLAVEMVEPLTEGKRRPVAEYVPSEWAEWLQSSRIELNAMTMPQFLEWLDTLFAPYSGKVIPPPEVQEDRLRGQIRVEAETRLTEKILEEAGLERQVDDFCQRMQADVQERLQRLSQDVQESLNADATHRWNIPIDKIAADLVREVEL